MTTHEQVANPVTVDHGAVLVPLDGSDLGERALRPAAWLADRLGAGLHTVTVGMAANSPWYRGYAASLRQRWPRIVPHCYDEHGLVHGIDQVARSLHNCLVCMGTHGRSRTAAVAGSNFVDVARSHVEPLVAIGPRAIAPDPDTPRRIVACVDGTPTSEQILPLAAAWARRLDTSLGIVAVVEPTPPLPNHGERHDDGPLIDPGSYLAHLVERPEFDGLPFDAYVVTDALGLDQGLIDHLQSHPAMLVAATSHLRTSIDRAVHGSAVAKLVHACPVPVLIQPAIGGS
jgi:nucleotide-binding universal stress UspA family protein